MQRRIYINGVSLGWPVRVLAAVLGVMLLLVGLAFGTMILSLAAIASLAMMVRVWWLRRQLQRQQPKTQEDVRVIEGEFHVLDPQHGERPGR